MSFSRAPSDISPVEFFTRWIPAAVDGDAERRAKLGNTAAIIVFELKDVPGGVQVTYRQVFEVEGEDKPACVAETMARLYF